jgi:hypothetical protein
MRAIRFLIYLTTLAYAAIIVATGPSVEPSIVAPGLLTSPILGASIGFLQVVACVVGLVLEFRPHSCRCIKWLFLFLSSAYIYEVVLQLVTGRSIFDWLPYFIYGTLSAIVYISEGLNNED